MSVHITMEMHRFSIEFWGGRDLKDYLGQSFLAKHNSIDNNDPALCPSKA